MEKLQIGNSVNLANLFRLQETFRRDVCDLLIYKIFPEILNAHVNKREKVEIDFSEIANGNTMMLYVEVMKAMREIFDFNASYEGFNNGKGQGAMSVVHRITIKLV